MGTRAYNACNLKCRLQQCRNAGVKSRSLPDYEDDQNPNLIMVVINEYARFFETCESAKSRLSFRLSAPHLPLDEPTYTLGGDVATNRLGLAMDGPGQSGGTKCVRGSPEAAYTIQWEHRGGERTRHYIEAPSRCIKAPHRAQDDPPCCESRGKLRRLVMAPILPSIPHFYYYFSEIAITLPTGRPP